MEPSVPVGQPTLRNPALVVAFTGWGDAGAAASSAALLLLRGRRLERVADLDPETFYVLTAARPLVRDTPRGRRIRWPSLSCLAGCSDGRERDLVVLAAAEPQLRWRTFVDALADTWEELGDGPAVLLGSFLAGVLHVGPVPIVGSGSTPYLGLLLRALGVAPNRYAGPTTAIMPLYEALTARGVECVNLWAAVPHYLVGLTNPKATAALIRVVSRVLAIRPDVPDLERAAAAFEARVNQAFARVPPQTAPGQALPPATEGPEAGHGEARHLPTGEEAIHEVERLLGLRPPGEDDQRPAEG